MEAITFKYEKCVPWLWKSSKVMIIYVWGSHKWWQDKPSGCKNGWSKVHTVWGWQPNLFDLYLLSILVRVKHLNSLGIILIFLTLFCCFGHYSPIFYVILLFITPFGDFSTLSSSFWHNFSDFSNILFWCIPMAFSILFQCFLCHFLYYYYFSPIFPTLDHVYFGT